MNLLKFSLPYLLVIAFTSVGNAQEGRVTVRVTDFDSGVPVTNAEVHAGFNTSIKSGWGWGGGRPNREIGSTGTNGECTLTGSGNGGSVGIAVLKEGYYGSSGYSVRFTNIAGNVLKRMQPWDPIVEVVLKRISNPVPLYARRIRDIEIPVENEPVSFDLVAGDWVEPHGQGKEADLVFQMDCQPEQVINRVSPHRTYDVTLYDVTLTVRGSNEGDGFYLMAMPTHGGKSSLKMPRNAPIDGYEPFVEKRAYNSADEPFHTDVRDDANYFFRIRTVKDEDSNTIRALYGKIHGDFQFESHVRKVTFTYYLNPVPNDRNLEFDPNHNLAKNLSPQEIVRDP